MTGIGQDQLKTRRKLNVNGKTYDYYSLKAAAEAGIGDISRLPFSLKILLENLLRFEDGERVTVKDIQALAASTSSSHSPVEIAFHPARVLMQDFTGVPAVVDLAAMRDALKSSGGNPRQINPMIPVDLVIDHSVVVDRYGHSTSFKENVEMEYKRNFERYQFLNWGQSAFENFRVVPPGTGICHQVNLEYLARGVWSSKDKNGIEIAYPDTLVGTDSHTTMINALAVLGWGVGGIEAEAAMLGQHMSMLIPEVVGFKLTGKLPEGSTATDMVLTITNILRTKGVVGKFVEFYGPGLDALSVADRATVSNMAPEYGATCGFFPIDSKTIDYLKFSGRDAEEIALTEAYAKEQGLWRDASTPDPIFRDIVELNLESILPTIAGPKRPQDKILLSDAAAAFGKVLEEIPDSKSAYPVEGENFSISHGDVVIAAITSCTNTSNPSVMLAAGLVAKKARERGLESRPWVKTSLAPGSQVVTDYLAKSGLDKDLNGLGFNLVGYGCTTCIGNSGPLNTPISEQIEKNDMTVCSVLSGNRNFEGRVNPLVKANYLASPPLVVAYALAGSMAIDITKDPIANDSSGKPVYLKDIWPTTEEIEAVVKASMTSEMFKKRYANVFDGDQEWKSIKSEPSETYPWKDISTYVKNPPYFTHKPHIGDAQHTVHGARILAMLGDSITTDHISPAGSIKPDSPAGEYLRSHRIRMEDYNSYGSRRGNHEVMMRGTFANIRLRNEMTPNKTGGYTVHVPTGQVMSIYDAAMLYQVEQTPLVIIAGKEYGTGSSRDWAAKGTKLLGVKAVIAESFERIHRSNLVGMGVLPLVFEEGVNRMTLGLQGNETVEITGMENGFKTGMILRARFTRANGDEEIVPVHCRIDTNDEIRYYQAGGILNFVLMQMENKARKVV